MSHAVSGSRRNLWRAARLVFGLAVFACMLGLAGAARAGGGLVQYASTGGSVFDQPALSGSELGRERGEGLDAPAPSAPGTADDVAIILWDEATPTRGGSTSASPSFGSNAGASAGVSVSVSIGP